MPSHRSILAFLAALVFVLSLPAQAQTQREFPQEWYWQVRQEHLKFEGRQAPPLTVGEWVGEDFDLSQMQGSIVLIDFWATWCGPCIESMPKKTEIAKKYAKDGVKVVGICVSGDEAKMPELVKANKAEYPNAFVQGGQVEKDWPTFWFPTYALVDRQGVVRAIGLEPEHIEDAIDLLLAKEAEGQGEVRIRPTWLEGDDQKRDRLKALEAKPQTPPALTVDQWHNSEPLALDQLKGKVVVLDFWATWSPSNKKTIPRHQKLIETYGEEGLVIIGVCATLGHEAIAEMIETYGITYPVCVDIENTTNKAYTPDGFSDYYVFDRQGNLRIADCANGKLEEAVKALLSEKVQDDAVEENVEEETQEIVE